VFQRVEDFFELLRAKLRCESSLLDQFDKLENNTNFFNNGWWIFIAIWCVSS